MITLKRRITPYKRREQTVSDYFVLRAQLNITKMTSSLAAYHVGIIYHLQWLMLSPIRVLNVYPSRTCHLLRIVRILNLF